MSKEAMGFFKVDRSLLDSDRWLDEPFTRAQAWIDIFGLAQHKDSHVRVRGIKIYVKRGQLARSLSTLSTRWKWSIKKIVRYLKELEEDGDIETQKNNIITLITVKKYNNWQGEGNAEAHAEAHAEEKQKKNRSTTYKNVKNVKNPVDSYSPTESSPLLPGPGPGDEIVFPDMIPMVVEEANVEVVGERPPRVLKREDITDAMVNKVFDEFYKGNKAFNFGNKGYRRAAAELIYKLDSLEEAVGYAEAAVAVQGVPYAPVVNNPMQLRDKLSEVKGFYDKKQSEPQRGLVEL